MDLLDWHTIRGHRLVLQNLQSKVILNNFNLYSTLKHLDLKWFLNEKGNQNFEERYELIRFDYKQFYKELIKGIEDNCDRVIFRDIRILKLTQDVYNRKNFEQLILNKW